MKYGLMYYGISVVVELSTSNMKCSTGSFDYVALRLINQSLAIMCLLLLTAYPTGINISHSRSFRSADRAGVIPSSKPVIPILHSS